MALSFLQTPASASLAQSPMAFTAYSTTNTANPGFQYIGELYYWTGSISISGSAKYTLTKYPNSQGVGIFDPSKIINSTLSDPAIANTSNVKYFKIIAGTQWLSGSQYVTGSEHTDSGIYRALDGYAIFQEPINQSLQSKTPFYPILTDGPTTQSFFIENIGSGSLFAGNIGSTQPNKVIYSGSNGNGSFNITPTTATSGQIAHFPQYPSQTGFPLSTTGLLWYIVQPYNNSTPLGTPIRFEFECIQKYPNVRIAWKNRFGQFDFLNFFGVSQTGFNTDRATYQPQIGSWEGTSLSYNNYNSQLQTYVVNAKQTLFVNTQWLSQDYNDIIKQLLSSDEIYWYYNEPNIEIRPITINVNSFTFKTHVVDKTIQYSFSFDWGQGYKLLI
jgi:hypothetical protein